MEITYTRKASNKQLKAVLHIAKALPDYFNNTGLEQIERDLATNQLYLAKEHEEVLGFALVENNAPKVAEVTWIAVLPNHHGHGVGRALIGRIAQDFSSQGYTIIRAKTLAATADYQPYNRTRDFWQRVGFTLIDIIDPYPGWEPGNPCAVYERLI